MCGPPTSESKLNGLVFAGPQGPRFVWGCGVEEEEQNQQVCLEKLLSDFLLKRVFINLPGQMPTTVVFSFYFFVFFCLFVFCPSMIQFRRGVGELEARADLAKNFLLLSN